MSIITSELSTAGASVVGALVMVLVAARVGRTSKARTSDWIRIISVGPVERRSKSAEGLVRAALALLSPTDRERYAEEWAADLLDQHGRLQRAGFALGVIYSATRLALRRALALAKR